MAKFVRALLPTSRHEAAQSHPLVSIALFAATGLLISITVVLVTRHPFGDWF